MDKAVRQAAIWAGFVVLVPHDPIARYVRDRFGMDIGDSLLKPDTPGSRMLEEIQRPYSGPEAQANA